MIAPSKQVRIAVIQDNPVFLDKEATTDKIGLILQNLAPREPDLVLFPESFIPGYPRGLDFGTKVGDRSSEGRALYARYYNESVDTEGPELKRLESWARVYNTYIVIGVTERVKENGSLFCSMWYISPRSGLIANHRTIKPTGQERVIWAEAGADSLVTVRTPFGILGGLICWENYMPLARMAMYNKGIHLYLAPTADARDSWTTLIQYIAVESRSYVLSSNQYFERKMYPSDILEQLNTQETILCRGGSVIAGPDGQLIDGPLFDSPGVLIADLDMNKVFGHRLDFDPAGHYSRDDLFKLSVPGQPDTVIDT